MIIDADTHITPSGEGIYIENLITMMEESGVDKALTWLQPPYMREVADLNKYVYQAVKDYPERILGFGWADPNLGIAKSKDMIKKCLYQYGFYGVKLNGAQNNFYIDNPEYLPLIDIIAEAKKILAFHVGADAYECTHPFRVAKIAAQYPELEILMVHMGGAGLPDLANSAIEIAEKYSNITMIASNVSPKSVLKAIKTLGSERVCFGSDTPFEFMHVELAKIQALIAGEKNFSSSDKVNILGGNIARIFGL